MPIQVSISVLQARSLPIMDRNRKTTDAYVEIICPNMKYITPVISNHLNPIWNYEVPVFPVLNEKELQEYPIVFRVLDRDIYTSDNLIGCVTIDLNCLLMREECKNNNNQNLMGWYPIYDTISGLCGELELSISVSYMEDTNPNKEGSVGIMFFSNPSSIPSNYQLINIEGLVDGLVVDIDPEFEIQEKFRTARKTNEKRQLWLYKLSMQLRCKVGTEARKLQCNCVLGYQQYFDVEGDSGIVGRAVGTACIIRKKEDIMTSFNQHHSNEKYKTSSERIPYFNPHFFESISNSIPILTLSTLPENLNYTYISTVSVRTVKYLGRLHSSLTDLDTRDKWWSSCRERIQLEGERVGGNCIYSYRETCSIDKDLCVLSCQGTAIYIGNSTYNAISCPFKCTHIFPNKVTSSLKLCSVCKQAFVPNTILSTSDLPVSLPIVEPPRLLYSAASINLFSFDNREEVGRNISNMLAPLEKSLITELLTKVVNMGRNAVFGLHAEIELGGTMLTGILTGTCVLLPNMDIQPALFDAKNCKIDLDMHTYLCNELSHINSKVFDERLRYASIYNSIFPSQDLYVLPSCQQRLQQATIAFKQTYYPDKIIHGVSRQIVDISSLLSSNTPLITLSKPLDSYASLPSVDIRKKEIKEQLYSHIQWKPKNILIYNITCDLTKPYILAPNNTLSTNSMSASNKPYVEDIRPITLLKRVKISDQSNALNLLVTYLYERLVYKIHNIPNCIMIGIDTQLRMPGEDVIEICITAMIAQIIYPSNNMSLHTNHVGSFCSSGPSVSSLSTDLPENSTIDIPIPTTTNTNTNTNTSKNTNTTTTTTTNKNTTVNHMNESSNSLLVSSSDSLPPATPFYFSPSSSKKQSNTKQSSLISPTSLSYSRILLTPLSKPSSYVIKRYLGNLSLHFIRESWYLEENSQIDEYFHRFLLEVFTITKAHVRNLGGNALVNLHILPQETAEEDVDQTYNMITISGDVVYVE